MRPNTKDIYEIVTALIIEKLEAGLIPWRQPWRKIGLPRNFVTGRPYRGVNLLLLANQDYASSDYLTFKQVQDLGGKVKKGEKGHVVILWLWPNENAAQLELAPREFPQLRYYHVFNANQCERLPNKEDENKPLVIAPIEICELIIADYHTCPDIVHIEDEAYYHAQSDFINMPNVETFKSMDSYYTTLFHELIHSTGHASRLDRKELTTASKFGSETYSIEELTGQIGACYLSSYAGLTLEEFDNNVAYIQGWLAILKKDKRFIVYACAHAQKAVDYILNVKHEEQELVELSHTSHGNE